MAISDPFATHPQFSYDYLDSTQGTRVHVISLDSQHGDVVSVSVSVDFGSKHLKCVDESGAVQSFPIGMAHFMEHFLFWLSYEDILIPLANRYANDPNALVTYDQTVWFLKDAWVTEKVSFAPTVDQRQKAAGINDITRRLLAVLSVQPSAAKIKEVMAKTRNDVELEIGYRHNKSSYPMKLELLSSLYREAPVRHDILGTSESLQEITTTHVGLALKLIRTNIKSIIIQGSHLSNETVSEVGRSILEMIAKPTVEPGTRPVPPPIESLEVNRVSSGLKSGFDQLASEAILGIKLPPLQESFFEPNELRRIYLISHLAMHYVQGGVSGIISPSFRTYFMGGIIDDPLFYWDKHDLYEAMKRLKVGLVSRFDEYRAYFAKSTELAFLKVFTESHGLMKLCQAGDFYDYNLNELVDTFSDLRAEDLDRLIAELRDTKGNASLVYTQSVD